MREVVPKPDAFGCVKLLRYWGKLVLWPADSHNGSMVVSVADAKNNLTKLLQAVERGERITISRHGKPIVDLVPAGGDLRKPRIFGAKRPIEVVDPDWAKPQNDVAAWLKGDV